jgi:histone-lysine N-methyltransferase ASH1L
MATPLPSRAVRMRSRSASVDSTHSALTLAVDSDATSLPLSETPPTTASDALSIASASVETKVEATSFTQDAITVAVAQTPSASTPASGEGTGRSRRGKQVATYNVKVLSGTAVHSPFVKNGVHKGKRDRQPQPDRSIEVKRRRTISTDTFVPPSPANDTPTAEARQFAAQNIEALNIDWTMNGLPTSTSQIGLGQSSKQGASRAQSSEGKRRSAPPSDIEPESLQQRLTRPLKRAFSKRSTQETLEIKSAEAPGRKTRASKPRELANLEDTPEFRKIDQQPVVHEVWSKGKLVVEEPPQKKKKATRAATTTETPESENEEEEDVEVIKPKKRSKTWLDTGLYAGQQGNMDWFATYSEQEKNKITNMPSYKPYGLMPLPMWHGQRLLHSGRHFRLPFDVCSPLPPGQPKPDEWRKTTKSKIGRVPISCTFLVANTMT